MNKKEMIVFLKKEIKKLNIKIDSMIIRGEEGTKKYKETCKAHWSIVLNLKKLN